MEVLVKTRPLTLVTLTPLTLFGTTAFLFATTTVSFQPSPTFRLRGLNELNTLIAYHTEKETKRTLNTLPLQDTFQIVRRPASSICRIGINAY